MAEGDLFHVREGDGGRLAAEVDRARVTAPGDEAQPEREKRQRRRRGMFV
jgi:hypothetical protein